MEKDLKNNTGSFSFPPWVDDGRVLLFGPWSSV